MDHPIRFEGYGFWDETISRWHGEGLPKWVLHSFVAMEYFKFEYMAPIHFGADKDPGFFPPFLPKVISTEGRTRIIRDFSGKTYKEFRDGSSSIPQHVDDPVHNADDFNAMKWRLQPDCPGRVNNPLTDATIALAKVLDYPLTAMYCGLFGFHRHLLGFERLMMAYFDMPELLHDISKTWLRLYKGILRKLVKKAKIDIIIFWEDMCFKSGPMISPRLFREFMSPYYTDLINAAREEGVENFWVDTDGDCTIVIPLFEEVGVNGMFPFEVQAGMDVTQVRRNHPKLMIWGGIDKRKLALTKEDIEKEVMSKVPFMLEHGGYIPCTDHLVPPDVSLDNFNFYVELMRSNF